jgi:glycosyltransferase involved in cell wall biosynthesis
LLSKYGRLGASTRLRSLQYLPFLEKHGITVKYAPLLNDDYIKEYYKKNKNIWKLTKGYIHRCLELIRVRDYDLIWIEKEVFPWLPDWIEGSLMRYRIPFILDYDDAISHNYDQAKNYAINYLLTQKIDIIMRRAKLVIVGNDYIRKRAIKAGARRVEYLPTVVDLKRYQPSEKIQSNRINIGWIGTPYTSKYLKPILPALIHAKNKWNASVTALGANKINNISPVIETLPWAEDKEVSDIDAFSIGVMPLPNTLFERGKCGYKLIQYMALSKPVIASPVGANTKIVENNVNGYLARTVNEWIIKIDALCGDIQLRIAMGQRGRIKVEKEYALNVTAPRLVSLLREAVIK